MGPAKATEAGKSLEVYPSRTSRRLGNGTCR